MRKFKKIGFLFIFLLAVIFAVGGLDTTQAADYGYTDHEHYFSANEDCGGCSKTVGGVYYTNKSAYTSTKCTACAGYGTGIEYYCSSCKKSCYGQSGSGMNCPWCSTRISTASGGSSKSTCGTCSGTGKWGKCGHCNGQGVNYYCQNPNCGPGYTSYDNWKTESGYDSVCYTTANTYTQTINHYLWNPNTSAWDYWTTTYGSGTYNTTYTPSYTTTPTGYYNYSLDWSDGWTVTGEGVFNAYYHPYTHTLAYDTNGGSDNPSSQTIYYGSRPSILSESTKDGYTFKYWSTTSYDLSDRMGVVQYTGDANIPRYWITNCGNGIFEVLVYSPTASSVSVPTWTTLGGQDDLVWHSLGSGYWERGGETFNFGTQITLDSHKGEVGEYTMHIYAYDGSGNALSILAANNVGFYFFYGDTYPGYMNGGTQTLYAQWTPNKYTVTLEANGGTCENDEGENVENVTMTFDTANYWAMNWCIPERKGYTFLGWYDALEGGTQVYGADGYCTNDGTYFSNNTWIYPDSIKLYAQWEHNEYTVTYDANGGDSENQEVVTYYDEPIDLSITAEKDGFVFVGWNTDPDAVSGLSSMKMPESDITLYAIYSIPVSDIKEVYLMTWQNNNVTETKTFQLERSETNHMMYTYVSNEEEVAAVLSTSGIHYQLIAKDYAGNYTVLKTDSSGPSPDVTAYIQTVEHYLYDVTLEKWVLYETVSEEKLAGEQYAPTYLDNIPIGYQTSHIEYPEGYEVADSTYTVKEDVISKAYYVPIEYKLNYDANGGSVTPSHKMIYYNDVYGELPTPERKGYTFKGWYTEKEEGTLIISSMKYEIPGDSTIYAHWELNKHNVTYDYWTNGGHYASASTMETAYGEKVDLSVTATKNGYSFVGWNTNPDACTGLTSLLMEDNEMVLYAIYKKDITLTIVEKTDSGQTTRILSKTIYNNETEASFTMTEVDKWTGWTLLGWTTERGAEETPVVGIGNAYTSSENETLYGLYTSTITLGYDTNGSAMKLNDQTKDAFCNASGNYTYPNFVIERAPVLPNHSFVKWNISSGALTDATGVTLSACMPGDMVTLRTSATLTAQWDKYPEIEAYNRYFTLEQAQRGEITEAILLEKVVGTDQEDGTLENGTDVIVIDYNASTFTDTATDRQVKITYQATDSFGNTVTKTVIIAITDTTAKKSTKKSYVRFISSQFFLDGNGNLVPLSAGGLEKNSIWRKNENYHALLQETLRKPKTNVETWVFTKSDIEQIKNYTDIYGYVLDALEEFLQLINTCRVE